MKEILLSIWQAKHTSIAGLVVLICTVGEFWFPAMSEKFHKTREFAMSYGLIMGGDAIRRGVKSGQTELLHKEEAKQP